MDEAAGGTVKALVITHVFCVQRKLSPTLGCTYLSMTINAGLDSDRRYGTKSRLAQPPRKKRAKRWVMTKVIVKGRHAMMKQSSDKKSQLIAALRRVGAAGANALLLLCLMMSYGAAQEGGQEGWWMKEPIRWVQTNLRQTDAGLDARRLAEQLADMRANVALMGMGGIAAYYPTAVEFHYPSPDLPAGRDMFGDVVREAHARRIRVVGRFDLSKTPKAVFDAHPEWFFRQANGQPVIYNGLYSTCINGGYYRDQGMKILSEALDKYAVDGLFFNMFGNQ